MPTLYNPDDDDECSKMSTSDSDSDRELEAKGMAFDMDHEAEVAKCGVEMSADDNYIDPEDISRQMTMHSSLRSFARQSRLTQTTTAKRMRASILQCTAWPPPARVRGAGVSARTDDHRGGRTGAERGKFLKL
jgi:hypothetical protein